jgi:hypothetical protein
MVFLLLELHARNQQTLCPAAADPKRADLHLGQQGIGARPVLTHLLAGSAMQKMGRAHNNSIHILIGLKELAPDLAILAARACLGEARHTVCKDELLLLHCSGMLLAPLAH